MIDGLTPYPAYKDSGVPWLGDVPKHWSIERLKSSVSNVIEQTAELRSGDLYIALEHVESWTGRLRRADSDVPFDSQVKRFRPGDVLFGKLRPYLAKVTRARSDGVCVGELLVLRPRGSDVGGAYLEQLLRSKPVIDAVNSSTFGAKMPRADWQFVGGMLITLPPLLEQAAIVRFLDYYGRKIRQYVHAKQKLIKLLEEQKQAIINRAVTRGLDPNVRLKSAGVEWLGHVPAHWEVKQLKYLVPHVTVGIVIQPARLYVEAGVPCLRSLNISGGFISPEKLVFISHTSNDEHRKSQIFSGDIVVVRTGQAGVAAIVTPEFDGANCIDLLIVRRSERLLSDYLFAYLNSWPARADVQCRSVGAIQAHYNTATLANLMVAAPPIAEQQEILDEIGTKLRTISELTKATHRDIHLVREYRTRLIADVVTGKLDVREAAAKLPDEAEEPEPSEEADALREDEEYITEDLDAGSEVTEEVGM